MNYNELYNLLKENMTFNGVLKERFNHSIGVVNASIKINQMLGNMVDEDKLKIAALLHDCAKYYSFEESCNILKKYEPNLNYDDLEKSRFIIHAFCGKYVAQEVYNVSDEEIQNAIYYHTTGNENMSTLEKIIFVADYIEEGRTGEYFDNVRKALDISLDYAVYAELKQTIDYLNSKNAFIYPLTFKAYEYYRRKI